MEHLLQKTLWPSCGGGVWRHRAGSVCLSEKSGEGEPRITTWKGEKSKEFYLQKDHLSLETIKVRSRCLVPSSVSLTSSPRVWRSQSRGCANVEKPKKGAFPIHMAFFQLPLPTCLDLMLTITSEVDKNSHLHFTDENKEKQNRVYERSNDFLKDTL